MQSPLGIVIFVLAIGLSIYLGEKFKLNTGLIAIAFAFFIGVVISGQSAASIGKMFNGSYVLNIVIVSGFYGFCTHNGSLLKLTQMMLYKMKNATWAAPILIFLIATLMGFLGAGSEPIPLMLSPIAFAIVLQLDLDPMLAVLPVYLGTSTLSKMPWSTNFITIAGVFETHMPEYSTAMAYTVQLLSIAMSVAMMTLLYIVYLRKSKRKKLGKAEVTVEKPEPFNREQRISVILICIVISLCLIPPVCAQWIKTPFFTKLAAICNIRVICAIGTVIAAMLKLADPGEVFKRRIPWGLIITISGVMLLISTVTACGLVDYIGSLLTNAAFSPFVMVLLFFTIGFALSYVGSALAIVYPLTAALGATLEATMGIPAWRLNAAAINGGQSTALSPFSTGGALALSACPDELRDSTVRKQMLWMIIEVGVCFLIQISGLPDLFVKLFL